MRAWTTAGVGPPLMCLRPRATWVLDSQIMFVLPTHSTCSWVEGYARREAMAIVDVERWLQSVLVRDRCVDPETNTCAAVTGDYHAWMAGGGQRCGVNDTGRLHTWCMPRDSCVDQDAPVGVCQRQSGPQYPGYKSAGGYACGEEGWFFVYCEPGDTCVAEETNRCE